MPRIRSIFPALTTDEAYMSMTMPTKAAWPALWMQCDDHGAFEWKPIVLKATIFPADNLDFETILSELERLNCVKKFTIDGKAYGLVRNFCRWQRPKEPSYRFAIPPEHYNYVGLNEDGSVPNKNASPRTSPALPQPSGSTAEKIAPREEIKGGDKRRRKSSITPSTESSVVVLAARSNKTTTTTQPVNDSHKEGSPLGSPLPTDWVPDEHDMAVARSVGMSSSVIEQELLQFHAYNASRGTFSPDWSATWFRFCSAWKQREQPAAKTPPRNELFRPTAEEWHAAVERWKANQSHWSRHYGPEPGMGACRCPADILIGHGIDPNTGLKIVQAASSTALGVK